mgnify:CR=1 FL=1
MSIIYKYIDYYVIQNNGSTDGTQEIVEDFFKDKNINTVINCAAYTAVDQAEEDAEIAEQVNAKGVLNLVNALKKVDGKLIHISTDYVFDGKNLELKDFK